VPEHVGEHAYVEAAVNLACQVEQFRLGEPSAQRVNVDEVASRGAIEQGDDLAAGEVIRCGRRSSDARTRGAPRGGVQGEIDEQVLGSVVEQSTECAAVRDSVDFPVSLTCCCEELIPGQPNLAGVGLGEEIQILRRAHRQPLRQ
jgi:hypothetical protein